jgi:CBS domain-containing protein
MTTVQDVLMSKGPDVIVAPSTATVLEAACMMAQAKVGAVVVRDGDCIMGIFTERDLLTRVVVPRKDAATVPLCEVMTRQVRTCRLDDDLVKCGEIMTAEHIRHLAVVEEGTLVGLVGVRDVMAARIAEPAQPVTPGRLAP